MIQVAKSSLIRDPKFHPEQSRIQKMERKPFSKTVDALNKGYSSAIEAYAKLPKAANMNEMYENFLAAGILGVANFSVHAFENEPQEIEIPETGKAA